MANDMEEKKQAEFYIGGRNLWKIPYTRRSFLYGIGGGLGIGLLSFLFTSKPRQATNHMLGSFFAITLSYWMYHRTKLMLEMTSMKDMHTSLQKAMVMEGTAEGKPFNKPHKVLSEV